MHICGFSTVVCFYQEKGEDILAASEGKKRKYLDFIDILLEARVSWYKACSLTV